MLNASYERTMEHSYVSFEVNDYSKNFEEEMLKHSIPGLLPFQLERQNERICFTYQITQKQEFMEYIQQVKLDCELICKLLNSIIRNIKEARDYLLEADNFILDPNYIYVGDEGESFWICYYMGYDKSIRHQLIHLFEAWMKCIDYDDQQTVKLVYALYHLARMDTCTYDQILDLLAKESEDMELSFSDKNKFPQDSASGSKEEISQAVCLQSEGKKNSQEGVIAMVEELSGEREELYYPISSYVEMAVGIITGVAGLLFTLRTSLLQTKYGQIDVMKVLCFVFIAVVVEVMIGRTLFQSQRKLSRMRSEVSYVSIHDEERSKNIENAVHKLGDQDYEKLELLEQGPQDMQQNVNESYDNYRIAKNQRSFTEEEIRPLSGNEKNRLLFEEEETQLLLGEEETQLLLKPKHLMLQSQKKLEEVMEIMARDTTLGSSRHHSDLLLNYPTISRNHARIVYLEDNYYLEDLSSTNGTYLNGRKLLPGEQKELTTKDMVQFAEYSYEISIVMK